MWWKQGLGHKAIYDALFAEYGESGENKAVSERTVGNWIEKFKKIPAEALDEDAPFEWHRLEEYGLPWEASPYILDIWASILVARPLTTVRAVRWWWRVHLAAPELSPLNIVFMAAEFEHRELVHEVFGQTMEMADLEAFLAFKPWIDEQHLLAYTDAVDRQQIPAFQNQLKAGEGTAVNLFTNMFWNTEEWIEGWGGQDTEPGTRGLERLIRGLS